MQLPNHCPICKGVMLTEFTGAYITMKNCLKNVSHGIKFVAVGTTDTVLDVELRLTSNPEIWAQWDLEGKLLTILAANPTPPGPYKKNMVLPFFYPDVYSYRKLIDKLKTYLVFS